MSKRRACAQTFEMPDVIATCLLEPDHAGAHDDYGNGIAWIDELPTFVPRPGEVWVESFNAEDHTLTLRREPIEPPPNS